MTIAISLTNGVIFLALFQAEVYRFMGIVPIFDSSACFGVLTNLFTQRNDFLASFQAGLIGRFSRRQWHRSDKKDT